MKKETQQQVILHIGQGSTEISHINDNLFNKDTITQNYYIDKNTGKLVANTSNNVSDYIRTDLDYVILQGIINNDHYALYDKNKQYISGGNLQNNVAINTTDASYIRFTIKNTVDLNKVELKNGNSITDFVEHKENDYILNIQQEMLSGDYFVKEDDGWKEVHNWNSVSFDGTESSWYLTPDINHRFRVNFNNTSLNNSNQYCTHSKLWSAWGSVSNSFSVRSDNFVYFNSPDFSTFEEFKTWLLEQNANGTPLTFWYECEQYKLACTEEQSAVLEELSNLDLFDGVNNIITAEDIALLKLKYALDVETYIDNKIDEKLANINAQILNIAGGN